MSHSISPPRDPAPRPPLPLSFRHDVGKPTKTENIKDKKGALVLLTPIIHTPAQGVEFAERPKISLP